MRQHSRGATTWQADLVPVTARFADDVAARPAVVLVTDGALPLHIDVLAHPPSDAAGVARTLESAVVAAAGAVGAFPSAVLVRDREVTRLLAGGRALHDTVVRAADDLPGIDALVRQMAAELPGIGPGMRIALPQTWAGWGLPDEEIADLFAAAAVFHRAAPWRYIANEQLLTATLRGGHEWTACVLGNGGQEFGLALYESRDDFGAFLQSDDPAEPFAAARGVILSLTYDRATKLPKGMRREVAARRWEVAGRDAYPVLFAVNTLGGGVTREQMAELAALLRTVPEFVGRHHDVLAGEAEAPLPIEWTDATAEVRIRYDGEELLLDGTLWGPHAVLTPGLATGPRAEPGASLLSLGLAAADDLPRAAEKELGVIERFRSTLKTGRGRGGKGSGRRQAEDARLFVDFLTGYQAVPVRAVSEFDLRVFLYDWYPRKVRASLAGARAVHATLGRFLAFLAGQEGIVCEWADEVLGEKEFFELRVEEFPGGFWWDDDVREWQQEIWEDLDARVMVPHPELGEGEQWGATMGMTEHALHHALQRQWLVWRDDVIRSGTVTPELVRAALVPRQHAWLRAPLPALGGRTPLDAIREERQATPTRRTSR